MLDVWAAAVWNIKGWKLTQQNKGVSNDVRQTFFLNTLISYKLYVRSLYDCEGSKTGNKRVLFNMNSNEITKHMQIMNRIKKKGKRKRIFMKEASPLI
jgi:hypothetical protein